VPAAHNAHALWFTITGTLTMLTALVCVATVDMARASQSPDHVSGLRVLLGTLATVWIVTSLVLQVF